MRCPTRGGSGPSGGRFPCRSGHAALSARSNQAPAGMFESSCRWQVLAHRRGPSRSANSRRACRAAVLPTALATTPSCANPAADRSGERASPAVDPSGEMASRAVAPSAEDSLAITTIQRSEVAEPAAAEARRSGAKVVRSVENPRAAPTAAKWPSLQARMKGSAASVRLPRLRPRRPAGPATRRQRFRVSLSCLAFPSDAVCSPRTTARFARQYSVYSSSVRPGKIKRFFGFCRVCRKIAAYRICRICKQDSEKHKTAVEERTPHCRLRCSTYIWLGTAAGIILFARTQSVPLQNARQLSTGPVRMDVLRGGAESGK